MGYSKEELEEAAKDLPVIDDKPELPEEMRELDYSKIKTAKDIAKVFSCAGMVDGIKTVKDLREFFVSTGREIDVKTIGDVRLVLQVLGVAFHPEHPNLEEIEYLLKK